MRRPRVADSRIPYNVARRATDGPGSAPGSHAIGDETRRIAEAFLATSPWLGNVSWGERIIGNDAEYLYDLRGELPHGAEPGEGQRWSWTVTFTDPSGQEQTLGHESVLNGVRELIYGKEPSGVASFRILSIRQWFTEPADERRSLKLTGSDSSRICQQALYGHQVFSTEDDMLGGKRLDFFEDQRNPAAET